MNAPLPADALAAAAPPGWPAPLTLPRAAGARVLAVGAWLKNSAGLLEGTRWQASPVHGDLGDPAARAALADSVERLLALAGGPLDAVAHDLHPDFHSTHLAVALARRLGVPAIAVQHHHAHVAVVQAEQGLHGAVQGLALDGVGLGTDGLAWGGELLRCEDTPGRSAWSRTDHLPLLPLPGGDAAAREPWRLAAAVLHGLARAGHDVPAPDPWLSAADGHWQDAAGAPDAAALRLITRLLERGLNCPGATGAGRWFDAAAGLLGLSHHQAQEAEAAIALERLASTVTVDALAGAQAAVPAADPAEALHAAAAALMLPLVQAATTARAQAAAGQADAAQRTRALAARAFHEHLADRLAARCVAAHAQGAPATVVLGGGCFFNRLLREGLIARLRAAGLVPAWPQALSCGDAGLALGQAWVAAATLLPDAAAPAPRPAFPE